MLLRDEGDLTTAVTASNDVVKRRRMLQMDAASVREHLSASNEVIQSLFLSVLDSLDECSPT